jgi:uncharacterized protein (DUF1800 family)
MNTPSPFTAANKFGYGLQPGELGLVGSDPRGWLLAQLPLADRQPARYQNLPGSAQAISSADADYRERRRLLQEANANGGSAFLRQAQEIQRRLRDTQLTHYNQRLAVAIESDTPFAERLVRFWSNHFTIATSMNKPLLFHAGLAYENESIRQHINGRFEDMLLAVARQPAMLIYLDNHVSLGPNSPAGLQQNRGLNENLAREMMELHTLGVNGGYTQDDVIALASMLTGWSVNIPLQGGNLPSSQAAPGAFYYQARFHEPGSQRLLGKVYANTGESQAESALRDLARHPSTARFVAQKLARHFISDSPPASAVDTLAKAFDSSHGDLPTLHRALVELDEAWDPAHQKLKTAEDYLVSVVRALPGVPLSNEVLTTLSSTLSSFNQTPFSATSPAGWSDDSEHWGAPDALIKRLEFINMVAQAVGPDFDARDIVAAILPPDNRLQTAIRRAESLTQALTLLLASPQFQWRV